MPFFDPKPAPEGGLHAAATERNRAPILEVLRGVLPSSGLVLEIASGTGQHVAYFAPALPALRWQPSDASEAHLASIAAWSAASGAENIAPPVLLEVEREPWPVAHADAIVNINMVHIAPWSAAEALFRGAARTLPAAGLLYMYGPFKRGGRHTAPSNERFDERLRAEDAHWGVRDVDDLERLATASGFVPAEIVEMPANNLSLIFRRRVSGTTGNFRRGGPLLSGGRLDGIGVTAYGHPPSAKHGRAVTGRCGSRAATL
jgi:SAM-dependent methyltransferase